jgi:DNA-binding transcriptional LysR family regulator
MRFDLTDLRLFVHVVEAGSITQGAERTHLAIGAASTRIPHRAAQPFSRRPSAVNINLEEPSAARNRPADGCFFLKPVVIP